MKRPLLRRTRRPLKKLPRLKSLPRLTKLLRLRNLPRLRKKLQLKRLLLKRLLLKRLLLKNPKNLRLMKIRHPNPLKRAPEEKSYESIFTQA